MSLPEYPICLWCKHFKPPTREKIISHCKAFPDGIPAEIIRYDNHAIFDHRYPHPEDGGVQFEREDDIDKLLKSRIMLEIAHVYPNDTERIWRVLNALFAQYDKRREQGTMNPPIEDNNSDKKITTS